MKYLLPVLSVVALSACVPPAVESRSGVGFQDYTLYQQQQAYLARPRIAAAQPPVHVAEAAPVETAAPAPVFAAAPAPAPVVTTASAPASQSIGAEALAALGTGQSSSAAVSTAPISAIAPTAVTSVAAPAPTTAIATPSPNSGTNIVAFALATVHPVGQAMYRRSNLLGTARTARLCAGYASDGLAQEAFLARGGPQRDPMGIDPDGDGYACQWDPAPFRMIRG